MNDNISSKVDSFKNSFNHYFKLYDKHILGVLVVLCLGLFFALYYVLTIPLDVQVAKFIQKHHENQAVLNSLKATSQGKGLLIPKK